MKTEHENCQNANGAHTSNWKTIPIFPKFLNLGPVYPYGVEMTDCSPKDCNWCSIQYNKRNNHRSAG